jgi:membrane-bound lytic murein transglycosylase B
VAIPLAKWQSMGVRTAAGTALPKVDRAASLLRAGKRNYLVYSNYDSLLGYNCAHAVCAGGGPAFRSLGLRSGDGYQQAV